MDEQWSWVELCTFSYFFSFINCHIPSVLDDHEPAQHTWLTLGFCFAACWMERMVSLKMKLSYWQILQHSNNWAHLCSLLLHQQRCWTALLLTWFLRKRWTWLQHVCSDGGMRLSKMCEVSPKCWLWFLCLLPARIPLCCFGWMHPELCPQVFLLIWKWLLYVLR